jgi:hypothetical protein
LYLKAGPGGQVVFDSRSGKVEEHPLGSNAMRLLELLYTPRRISDLQELGSGAEGEVEVLRRRGWLFEEAGRFLSLVLPREPPEPSHPNGFFAMEEN